MGYVINREEIEVAPGLNKDDEDLTYRNIRRMVKR